MGYRHKLFAARGFGVLGAFGIATALQASAQAAGGAILQPVQSVLQEIVTTLTGPLGVLIGALALVGIGVLWATGRLDVRAAISSIIGIALIGTALVVAEAVMAAAGA
jgi:type IV secretion system protein VirB2